MRTGVVLINWNAADYTIACIESLLRGATVPWRILVIDNHSGDDSADRIQARFPEVRMVRSVENLGFVGANNVGIRRLLDEGAEAVWVLNNDTVVHPDCLRELIACLDRNPDAAASTGKILYLADRQRLWYAGGDVGLDFAGHHRGLGDLDAGQAEREEPVGFLTGCCMLVRAAAFSRVGFLHPAYFAYHEDVEWSCRAAERRASLWYTPRAVLWHAVSGSMRKNAREPGEGTITAEAHYLEARNRLFTIRLHAHRTGQRLLAASYYALRTLWLAGGFCVRGRGTKLRAVARGIRDGLTGELLPVPGGQG